MSGGLIATIVAIISLLATFLMGKKTGAIKENEKLKLNLEAYTEKMETRTKEAEVKADAQERKADLATKVAETVAEKSTQEASSIVSLSQMREALNNDNAFDIARRQAERAKEYTEE